MATRDKVNVLVNVQELEALELVVYVARAQEEGHSTWFTMSQALDNLDSIRDEREIDLYDQDEDEL